VSASNVPVPIRKLPGKQVLARSFKTKVVKSRFLAVLFALPAGPLEDGEPDVVASKPAGACEG
jgi:hypothetical protein